MPVGVVVGVAFAFCFRIAPLENRAIGCDEEMIRNVAPSPIFAHAPVLNICDVTRSILRFLKTNSAVVNREAGGSLLSKRPGFQCVPFRAGNDLEGRGKKT